MPTGEAIAYGAATVVNAIATGRGASFGIKLWTKARVELHDNPGKIFVSILSDPAENQELAKNTVRLVLKRFRLDRKKGAYITTSSNIPIARGLKSSSVAANAIALATLGALRKKLPDKTILNLVVDAAIKSQVTITGAFDDASASYFGGVVVTDNSRRKILRRYLPNQRLRVLLRVPEKKSYTFDVNTRRLERLKPLVNIAHKQALKGKWLEAMTFNGLIYSPALDYDNDLAMKAIHAGALAAGLSGKGPAMCALIPQNRLRAVMNEWRSRGVSLILTGLNIRKAHLVRVYN